MTQNKINAVLLALALTACTALAHAQTITRGLYLGGAMGQSEATEYKCSARPQCEQHGTVGKFFMGFQFGRNWALELALADLGQINSSVPGVLTDTVKVRLGELALLGSYPVTDRFMAYAKGGAYYAQTTNDQTNGTVAGRVKESNGGLTYGFGAQYFLTSSIAARGEFQSYLKVGGGNIGDSDYKVFTVGLLWKIK
jgi:opacity protein-like surface antigen